MSDHTYMSDRLICLMILAETGRLIGRVSLCSSKCRDIRAMRSHQMVTSVTSVISVASVTAKHAQFSRNSRTPRRHMPIVCLHTRSLLSHPLTPTTGHINNRTSRSCTSKSSHRSISLSSNPRIQPTSNMQESAKTAMTAYIRHALGQR